MNSTHVSGRQTQGLARLPMSSHPSVAKLMLSAQLKPCVTPDSTSARRHIPTLFLMLNEIDLPY